MKLASARRAVRSAERRLAEQEAIVSDRRAQLRFAMARGCDARSETLISAGATFETARVELGIRERVLVKTRECLARVLNEQPTPPGGRNENKQRAGARPVPPQNESEIHMSRTQEAIEHAVTAALEADATPSELARARSMPAAQSKRYLALRAQRRAQTARGAER